MKKQLLLSVAMDANRCAQDFLEIGDVNNAIDQLQNALNACREIEPQTQQPLTIEA